MRKLEGEARGIFRLVEPEERDEATAHNPPAGAPLTEAGFASVGSPVPSDREVAVLQREAADIGVRRDRLVDRESELRQEVAQLEAELDGVRRDYAALSGRRAVRIAVFAASVLRPYFLIVRGLTRRMRMFRTVRRREGWRTAVRLSIRVLRRRAALLADVIQGLPSLVAERTFEPHEVLQIRPDLSEEALGVLVGAKLDARPADIVCLSVIDWDFRYQRPQQLMAQFAAAGHRVFYVSHSRRLPDSRSGPARAVVRQIRQNIYEVHLAVSEAPSIYQATISGRARDSLLDSLDELRRAYGIDRAVTFSMIGSWAEVALEARQRWGWAAVYDCIDEWGNFPGVSTALIASEELLVRESDVMLASATALQAKWSSVRVRDIHLVRNAADCDYFVERCRANALLDSNGPSPIIGYYGAISKWFDTELIARVALKRPDWQFVLIGAVTDIDVSPLQALPNVRFLGERPYADIPSYLYHFDVCMIPFVLNHLTNATDPVKVYEYLSVGKPVVATRMNELAGYGDYVRLVEGADEFHDAIAAALEHDNGEVRGKRAEFARRNSWEARFKAVTAALEADLRVSSIVVVTYNNIAKTRACLTSLIKNTGWPAYEIIVVDNASTDGTCEYLSALQDEHPRVRVIRNDENRGFAAANNQGLDLARGEYLILLNNDTIVPPGWLTRLLRHLDDENVGLVGPMTNSVGNEARLDVGYTLWHEMESFALELAGSRRSFQADIPMLAMFCVALRRDVWERVGPLDERFGIGMFEDDDYSLRVKESGLRVVCVADVFVHHFGSASFNLLRADGTYDRLFETNRNLFETKWGRPWHAHRLVPLDMRQANDRVQVSDE